MSTFDPFERTAKPHNSLSAAHGGGKCACGRSHQHDGGECAECRRKRLQAQRQTSPVMPERDSGRPLDPGSRSFMESRFGHDFGRVRIHSDAQSTRALSAQAYTVGEDIVFAPGRFTPQHPAGQELLAHELVHVVQNRQGGGASAGRPSGVSQPGDKLERQADWIAGLVMSGNLPGGMPVAAAPAGSVIQRRAEAAPASRGAAPAGPATGPAAPGRMRATNPAALVGASSFPWMCAVACAICAGTILTPWPGDEEIMCAICLNACAAQA
jgi:hypothetical protein